MFEVLIVVKIYVVVFHLRLHFILYVKNSSSKGDMVKPVLRGS